MRNEIIDEKSIKAQTYKTGNRASSTAVVTKAILFLVYLLAGYDFGLRCSSWVCRQFFDLHIMRNGGIPTFSVVTSSADEARRIRFGSIT